MPTTKPTSRNPWAWVSTVYLAEGLPYVVVMSLAVILYKGLGISNTDIAAWTSLLYLPWVLKPLWSPVVDILKTRRAWIWFIQIVLGAGFAGIALSLHTSRPFRYSLAIFWVVAFSSATHDIAIDGFYMLATTASEQAFFVGIRSTFYRIANIVGQGLLVILAGAILDQTGLRNLDLRVSAAPDAPMSQFPQAGQFSGTPLAGELRIVAEPGTVVINPKPRPRAEIAAVIGLARSNNVDSGFYASESASQKSAAAPEWAITRWLRSKFGRKTEASEEAGNSSMISFHLSKPPGREVVV